MSKDIVPNEAVGHLKILGRRHVAADMQALCEHLDLLVGPQVAEVIINSHESRLGKQDAEELQRENPNATKVELIRKLEHSGRLSGIGAVETKLLPTEEAPEEIEIRIGHPCVTMTQGSAKSFLFSHWWGALSVILGGEFETKDVIYDQQKDEMRGRIARRATTSKKHPATN